MSLRSVVLPLPEAPMIAIMRPRGACRLMPFRTARPSGEPYEKFTDRTSTRASAGTRGNSPRRERHFSSFAAGLPYNRPVKRCAQALREEGAT